MKSFPFEIQPDRMDCGVICLKMISQFYGKFYTTQTFRDLCFISKEGVSLLSISAAAEKIGFKTVGGKITVEKLINEIPLP